MTGLAPHGGCNWEGCKECFPDGPTSPVSKVTTTGVLQFRPVEGGEWEDLSTGWNLSGWARTLADRAIARHKIRHGSCYTYRLVKRTTVVTDEIF
jgi:hypothetical protein